MYCKNCGKKIDSNDKYCPNCGEKQEKKSNTLLIIVLITVPLLLILGLITLFISMFLLFASFDYDENIDNLIDNYYDYDEDYDEDFFEDFEDKFFNFHKDENDISLNDYFSIKKDDKENLIIVCYDNTKIANNLKEEINAITEKNKEITVNYLEVDDLEENEIDTFKKSDEKLNKKLELPLILITKNDEIIYLHEGNIDIFTLEKALKENGIID